MDYNVKRVNVNDETLEDYGDFSYNDLKTFCEAHFLGESKAEYGVVFETKTALNEGLYAIKTYGEAVWFLGRNPDTGAGEEVVIKIAEEPEEELEA